MKVKLNGVTYKSKPEKTVGYCTGCALVRGSDMCNRIYDEHGVSCGESSVIWVEKVPKTFEYEGKTYRAKREQVAGKCDGCAFSHDPRFDCGGPLEAAVAAGVKGCGGNDRIYVEVKKPEREREQVEPVETNHTFTVAITVTGKSRDDAKTKLVARLLREHAALDQPFNWEFKS